MMTLMRLLPFLIGDYVEYDDHWRRYLILLAICDKCCAFEISPSDPTKLAWLIQTYLESFVSLYTPKYSVIPKMHYLVHLPKQMIM